MMSIVDSPDQLERGLEGAVTGAVSLLVWLTKALVVRAHPRASELSKKIINCFEIPAVAKVFGHSAVSLTLLQAAADGIFVIMEEQQEVLNKQTHAVLRLMYKQRFFQSNLPLIVAVSFLCPPTLSDRDTRMLLPKPNPSTCLLWPICC